MNNLFLTIRSLASSRWCWSVSRSHDLYVSFMTGAHYRAPVMGDSVRTNWRKSLMEVNPLRPIIRMHILQTVLYTSPKVLIRRICSTTGAHYSCSTIKSLFSWWSFLLFSCKLKLSLLKKGSVYAFIRMLMKKNFRWLFQFLLVDSFYDLPERQCNDRKKFRPVRDLRHLQYLFLIRVDI